MNWFIPFVCKLQPTTNGNYLYNSYTNHFPMFSSIFCTYGKSMFNTNIRYLSKITHSNKLSSSLMNTIHQNKHLIGIPIYNFSLEIITFTDDSMYEHVPSQTLNYAEMCSKYNTLGILQNQIIKDKKLTAGAITTHIETNTCTYSIIKDLNKLDEIYDKQTECLDTCEKLLSLMFAKHL